MSMEHIYCSIIALICYLLKRKILRRNPNLLKYIYGLGWVANYKINVFNTVGRYFERVHKGSNNYKTYTQYRVDDKSSVVLKTLSTRKGR